MIKHAGPGRNSPGPCFFGGKIYAWHPVFHPLQAGGRRGMRATEEKRLSVSEKTIVYFCKVLITQGE